MSSLSESLGSTQPTYRSLEQWESATRSQKKDLWIKVALVIGGLGIFATGFITTFFLYSHLGEKTFAILGSSTAISIVFLILAFTKKAPDIKQKRQALIQEFADVTKIYVDKGSLETYESMLKKTQDFDFFPLSFLKTFLSESKARPEMWRRSVAAVLSGNVESIRSLLQNQAAGFWNFTYSNLSIIELAAVALNSAASNQQIDSETNDLLDQQKEIFVILHQAYAEYLKTLDKSEKDKSQAKMLFRSAELCLKSVKFDGLTLNGCKSSLQDVFSKITPFYVPDCPHLAYVTAESLEKKDPLYNANQSFYAEWCHLTALAFKELLKETYSLDAFLKLGGQSRYLLALICQSEKAEHYGIHRLRDDDSVIDIQTPLNDPECPRYQPWYEITYKPWKINPEYAIEAVDPDGNYVEGTTFGDCLYNRKNEKAYFFSWKHGHKLKELHKVSQRWLHEIMKEKSTEKSSFDLGAFYHSLCQYTPLVRGSATFSYMMLMGILLLDEKKLPQSVTLLDCYALSMQLNDFIDKIFKPWLEKNANDEDLKKELADTIKSGLE